MSETYGVSIEAAKASVAAPDLPYRPPVPRNAAALPIGLIGCGGITQSHLAAYRHAGFHVVALGKPLTGAGGSAPNGILSRCRNPHRLAGVART
jgi:hypothetical protein